MVTPLSNSNGSGLTGSGRFYDQKNHPSHHEDLPNLSDVIVRLQASRSADQEALVASAEKYLMAAQRRRVGR